MNLKEGAPLKLESLEIKIGDSGSKSAAQPSPESELES